MSVTLHKTIFNNFTDLDGLIRESSEFLEKKTAPKTTMAVTVALEEMIANTIKYGYDDQAAHRIETRIEITEPAVRVTIIDNARAFNPLLVPEPDTSKPIEEREIGGLGIHLARQLMAVMDYRRSEGKNILVMEFK